MNQCPLCLQDCDNTAPVLCDFCKPNGCVKCSVSGVYYDEESLNFKCSHGCSFSVDEYVQRKLKTIILNGTSTEKIAFGGYRVEMIVPDGTPVKVHEKHPTSVDSSKIIGIHCTKNKEKILEHGIKYPPHNHDRDDIGPDKTKNETVFKGTIRENAIYAWPHKLSYFKEDIGWPGEPVFIEVPREKVAMSSYRYYRMAGGNEDWGGITFPVEKYVKYLTFSPSQVKSACAETGKPFNPNVLIY